MGRVPLLPLGLLLLSGCVTMVIAHLPPSLVQGPGGNGWERDDSSSDPSPRSEYFGLASHAKVTYKDKGGSPRGYPGVLTIFTLKALLSPSDFDLKEKLREAVEDSARGSGITLTGSSREGERTVGMGATSVWFVYGGEVSTPSTLFRSARAEVRILGEVWHCRPSGTNVLAVGIAQISEEVTTLGVPQKKMDSSTWTEIVADPSGTIDGSVSRDGLAYRIECT